MSGNLKLGVSSIGDLLYSCKIAKTEDFMSISGKPEIKVGDNKSTVTPAEKYSGEKYLSVVYSEANKLSLTLDGKTFTVTTTGADANSGVVVVALYDSEAQKQLVEVQCFELCDEPIPKGAFSADGGYVKAMWFTDYKRVVPYCKAVKK